ncbi:LysR family transcriptional regulator [Bordetella genomosp. 13]|uniref:LysR family transcriptional regulator n=1 Tax=Bordetella genomosp. 13 TaxID=463040 RepID=UPI0011A5CA8C|nr:LysR family transcriptional regulator [Bordetella genomosp. 13]
MKSPTLLQLQALLAVVRTGSFSKAADQLNVTQPSISLRIKELEAVLDASLLVRQGRSAEPTPEGLVAVRYAEQALGLLDELGTRLRTGDPLHGSLRLGSSETISITCLPEIIALLEDTFPNLRVELSIANSFLLCDQVARNKLDIAFVTRPDSDKHVSLEPLAMAEIAWLGSARRPLSEVLRPRDLSGLKILSTPPPSPLHDVVTKWCATDRIPLPNFSTCNSTAALARLVARGVGMSVLPVCVLAEEVRLGSVVRYRQREAFKPLRIYAARPAAVEPARLDTVVRIARHVMQKQHFFKPIPA